MLRNQLEYVKRTSKQSIYSRVRLHVSTRGYSSSGPYNFADMFYPLWDPEVGKASGSKIVRA